MVDEPLGQRAQQHQLALGHRYERVAQTWNQSRVPATLARDVRDMADFAFFGDGNSQPSEGAA